MHSRHGLLGCSITYVAVQENEILDLFLTLKDEILAALDTRKQFLAKPVTLSDGFEANNELVEAVTNLSQGKKPFELAGMFGKSEQKRILDAVVVVSAKPASTAEWSTYFSSSSSSS